MLARVWKSHNELGISKRDYESLLIVYGGLVDGRFYHCPDGLEKPSRKHSQIGFNLAEWNTGTAGCIGGWMEVVNGVGILSKKEFKRIYALTTAEYSEEIATLRQRRQHNIPTHTRELGELFVGEVNRSVTMAQAACAIENYLCTGRPQWNKVMGRE